MIAQLKNLRFLDTKKVTLAERKLAKGKVPVPDTSATAPASLEYNDCNGNATTETARPTSFSGLARFFPMSWLRREPKVYTALPESRERTPRVAYGKLNYKYIGNESEGNRFIMNKDL